MSLFKKVLLFILLFFLPSCHFGLGNDYSNKVITTRKDGSVRMTLSNHKNEKVWYQCRILGRDKYICTVEYKVYEFGKDEIK